MGSPDVSWQDSIKAGKAREQFALHSDFCSSIRHLMQTIVQEIGSNQKEQPECSFVSLSSYLTRIPLVGEQNQVLNSMMKSQRSKSLDNGG